MAELKPQHAPRQIQRHIRQQYSTLRKRRLILRLQHLKLIRLGRLEGEGIEVAERVGLGVERGEALGLEELLREEEELLWVQASALMDGQFLNRALEEVSIGKLGVSPVVDNQS